MKIACLIGCLIGLGFGLAAGAVAARDPDRDLDFDDALDCSAPSEVTTFKAKLPNTARAIHAGKGLRIVAIGSSSTEGVAPMGTALRSRNGAK